MSILIKGMEMPKDKPIRIVLNPNGQLFVDHGVHFTEYEAVELPPHGRLIDADALQRRFDRLPQTSGDVIEAEDVFDVIRTAPTIIEAEGTE